MNRTVRYRKFFLYGTKNTASGHNITRLGTNTESIIGT